MAMTAQARMAYFVAMAQHGGGSGDPVTTPIFTAQPQSQTVNQGDSVTLSVTVIGDPTPSLQWFKDGEVVTGATASSYLIALATQDDIGSYYVRAENPAGIVFSGTANLAVALPAGVALSATTATVSETGTTDTFTVVLDSEPASDVTIGITSADTGEVTVSPATLTFTSANWNSPQTVTLTGVDDALVDGDINTAVTVSVDGGPADYTALANQTVTVTTTDDDVGTSPIITAQPSNELVAEGGTLSLSVTATGTGLSYQWRLGGVDLVDGGDISGATTASPTVANFVDADGGDYTVVVSNGNGSVTSTVAKVVSVPGMLAKPSARRAADYTLTTGDEVTAWGPWSDVVGQTRPVWTAAAIGAEPGIIMDNDDLLQAPSSVADYGQGVAMYWIGRTPPDGKNPAVVRVGTAGSSSVEPLSIILDTRANDRINIVLNTITGIQAIAFLSANTGLSHLTNWAFGLSISDTAAVCHDGTTFQSIAPSDDISLTPVGAVVDLQADGQESIHGQIVWTDQAHTTAKQSEIIAWLRHEWGLP